MGLLIGTRLKLTTLASMASTSMQPLINVTPSSAVPLLAEDSAAVIIFQITSLVVILIAAFLGNGVIFLVFMRKPSLLSVSNRFILHLAVCNFLMCVVVMPPVLVSVVSTDWMPREQSCVTTGFLNVLLFAAIILTLVMITVDRYIAVTLPLHYYTYMTPRRASFMMVAVWAVALTLAIPPLLGWNTISYHHNRFICTAAVPGKTPSKDGYDIFLILGIFAVPLTAIAFMYSRMCFAARDLMARDRHRWLRVPSSDDASTCSTTDVIKRPRTFTSGGIRKILRVHIGDEWRTAQTTLMVMFSFALSWLPYYVVEFVEASLNRHVSPFWEWVPLWLALSSSAFNPYVYVFRSASMRHHAFSLFGVRRRPSIINAKLCTEA